MNILVFDIETVPDVEAGRKLYGLEGLSDEDTVKAMLGLRRRREDRALRSREILPHHLQRVVAIAVMLRTQTDLRLWSLGQTDSVEAELLQRFYDGIERFRPQLVSWNGSGFDLPVIHFRSLLHGVSAPCYWDIGDGDRGFRFNNYLGRYHWRHIDLMDVLAGFNPRAFAPLDQIAVMLNLPGKLDMDGSQVWTAYLAGNIKAIREYCELDVLNTYLIYLRFEQVRGQLTQEDYDIECARVHELLHASDQAHLKHFLTAWPALDQSGP